MSETQPPQPPPDPTGEPAAPPGDQPTWQAQAQAQPSGDGLDPPIGGLLSYLLFGWIGGLIMFLTQKHPEVRFHGAQSILLSIGLFAVYMALAIMSSILSFGLGNLAIWGLFSLLYTVLGIAVFALWIVLCIKGYRLEHFKLPVIGDMAERWAAR